VPVSGANVFQVVNDGTVDTAVTRFLAALESAAPESAARIPQ
jgi:thymidine phosphorylase/ribose 1,5-bisphosphokinase